MRIERTGRTGGTFPKLGLTANTIGVEQRTPQRPLASPARKDEHAPSLRQMPVSRFVSRRSSTEGGGSPRNSAPAGGPWDPTPWEIPSCSGRMGPGVPGATTGAGAPAPPRRGAARCLPWRRSRPARPRGAAVAGPADRLTPGNARTKSTRSELAVRVRACFLRRTSRDVKWTLRFFNQRK